MYAILLYSTHYIITEDLQLVLQQGARYIVAIFYPFSQFCEINISLLSLQRQPKTAPPSISEWGRLWQVR